MATVGIVRAIVTADVTQLKKGMTDAQRSADKMATKMKAVGKSMSMKVTLPLLAVGGAAAKMASDFEFSMTQIETLVGRSVGEVETLKGAVLGLSGETGRAPKELADAMFFITSAGLDASSATAALEASAKAAAVGLGDTVVVADAVTNAMNGYGMSADGAAFATDVLAKTVEQGKASAADLAPQFGRLIPMAAELGISFDQVGGGLAFLTRASGDAAMSATQLGGVMNSYLKPSQAAKKVLEEVGINLHDLRAAASEDLLGALQGLREKLEASGYEMSNVFEDIRGLNGALQLTGVATGAAREVFDELADSTGKLDEAFLGVQKTAQFKMSQAMSAMKASMITLGEQVLPVLVPIIQGLAAVIGKLAEHFGALPGPVQKVAVVLGVLLAAAGPVLMMLGAIKSSLITLVLVAKTPSLSMATVLPPLLAIIAVAAAVYAIWKVFSNRAKEAQVRTDTLRDSFVALDDRAGTLKSELAGRRGELDALNDATDAAALTTTDFSDQAVLLGELIERDVRKPFNDYFKDLEHHNELIRDPVRNNSYEDLADGLSVWTGQMDSNIRKLEDHSEVLGADADNIIKAVRNGDLQIGTLKNMLYALDETADAHDDLAKENDKLAKKWLDNTDNVVAYVQALDEDVLAEIAALEAKEDWIGAATLAIDATKAATEAAREEAEAIAARTVAINEGANALMGYVPPQEELSAAARFAALSFAEQQQQIKDTHRTIDMLTSTSRENAAALEEQGEAARDAGVAMAGMFAAGSEGAAELGATFDLQERMTAEAQALAAAIQGAGNETELRLHPAFANASDEVIEMALNMLDADRALSGLQREALGLPPPLEEAVTAVEKAEKALQAKKDALQVNIDLAEQVLAVAEAELEALEQQAEAARAPVEALKERVAAEKAGFEALKGAYYAAQDLADAEADVAAIGREIEAVTLGGGEAIAEATAAWEAQKQVGEVVKSLIAEKVRAEEAEGRVQKDLAREALKAANSLYNAGRTRAGIDREINRLAAERVDVVAEEGRFQRELTRELNAQRLAHYDINAQVEELTNRQEELSAGAIQAQRDLVTALQTQQAAITEVEQALIDLGIVSETDAAQANISASQAKGLIELQEALADTEAGFAAGEMTTLDLIEAQDAYNTAVANPLRPIDDLERATEDLARMEQEAARIGFQLAVARDKQTLANEALTAAEDIAGQVTEKTTAIDALAADQSEKLKMAIDAETVATEANTLASDIQARTDEELARIDEELAKVNDELTAATNARTDAQGALAVAEAEAIVMGEMTAIQTAELERLNRELIDAQWDLVTAEYANKDATVALAEAGWDVIAPLARMSELSGELGDRLAGMSTEARKAYPQFDIMKAKLADLEPKFAAVRDRIAEAAAEVGRLVAQMEVLNRTKIDQATAEEIAPSTAPTTAKTTTDEVVEAVTEVVEAVTEVVEAVKETAKAAPSTDIHNIVSSLENMSQDDAVRAWLATEGAQNLLGIKSAASGGFVKSAGLVNVHAGETITPAGGGVTVIVNVEGSVSSERDLVESIRRGLLRAQQSGRSVVLN